MKKNLLEINVHEETKKIIAFIKKTLKKQGFKKVVIGLSGGLDSTTVYYLLKQAVGQDNIITVNFPYLQTSRLKSKLPFNKIFPVNQVVEKLTDMLDIKKGDIKNNIRIGNIVARIRMTVLFDLAKKNQALVCGTENRSEKLLGYYTRFGDQASDLEPISHLYKTQVTQLAWYLKVPEEIIAQRPTAGLWSGQTDEDELGFSYEEADEVLCLYCDKKMTDEQIIKLGFNKAKKIINRYKQNLFKKQVPYHI